MTISSTGVRNECILIFQITMNMFTELYWDELFPILQARRPPAIQEGGHGPRAEQTIPIDQAAAAPGASTLSRLPAGSASLPSLTT